MGSFIEGVSPAAPSIGEQHITSSLQGRSGHVESQKVRAEDVEKIHFMDDFRVNGDGWICGEDGELLLWIPQLRQLYFIDLTLSG